MTVVLSGLNDEAHIEENLAIADAARPNSLTDKERGLASRVAAKYRGLMKVGCTGCGYCMPCPMQVDIPVIFELYNKMHMFGNEAEAKLMYAGRLNGGLTGAEPGYASQCIRCGECVDKCPQHLPIPDTLADVVDELEGPDLDERIETCKAIFTAEPLDVETVPSAGESAS